jgi:hypothetical protein
LERNLLAVGKFQENLLISVHFIVLLLPSETEECIFQKLLSVLDQNLKGSIHQIAHWERTSEHIFQLMHPIPKH